MPVGLSVLRSAWKDGHPPVGKVVEVWYWSSVILAVWMGQVWKTTEGQVLAPVTHWRFRA